jgi:hypothetical protein
MDDKLRARIMWAAQYAYDKNGSWHLDDNDIASNLRAAVEAALAVYMEAQSKAGPSAETPPPSPAQLTLRDLAALAIINGVCSQGMREDFIMSNVWDCADDFMAERERRQS